MTAQSITISELAKIAAAVEITPEMIAELNERLRVADAEFERKAQHQRNTMPEFLNRTYTI